MKLFSRPDGFRLYSKLGVDFFSTSDLLYPNMKKRLHLIRAELNFYMISDNPNVSLGIVDCSVYTHRIVFKDDYHKKNNGHECTTSRGVQLFGNSGRDFYLSRQKKPVHP